MKKFIIFFLLFDISIINAQVYHRQSDEQSVLILPHGVVSSADTGNVNRQYLGIGSKVYFISNVAHIGLINFGINSLKKPININNSNFLESGLSSIGNNTLGKFKLGNSILNIGHDVLGSSEVNFESFNIGNQNGRKFNENGMFAIGNDTYEISTGNNLVIGRANLKDTSASVFSSTLIGNYAGHVLSIGPVTAVGNRALYFVKNGSQSTALGFEANYGNPNNQTSTNNVSFGAFTQKNSVFANDNIAIGYAALTNGSHSKFSVAIGDSALASATHASFNIGVGHFALKKNELGNSNISIGYNSLFNSSYAGGIIAIGNHALYDYGKEVYNTANIIKKNIAIGPNETLHKFRGNLTFFEPESNLALGSFAGRNLFNESKNNIFLGNSTAEFVTSGDSNVLIGFKAGFSLTGSIDNRLIIENAGSQYLIQGDFSQNSVGINFTRSGFDALSGFSLMVNGQAYKNVGSGNWVTSSDRRLKTNIRNINSEIYLKKIGSLRPTKYNWKNDPYGQQQYGFIAQELEQVFPELIKIDQNGLYQATYGAMKPHLVAAIIELTKELEELKRQLKQLNSKISMGF